MNKLIYSALLTAGVLVGIPAKAKVEHILPKPQQVNLTQGAAFSLNRTVALTDPTNCVYLKRVLTNNGCTLQNDAAARITVELVTEIPGAFNHRLNLFPDEAYALNITENEVVIQALTPTGVIRAAQTLQQMAEGYEGETAVWEALTMTDWPAFKLRGYMHDVGRSFISYEELKKQVDLLARFKVNVFHWHLTDYTGWRFEVKAYPQLTAKENNIRYAGSYYTQEQCRELVAYAAERGVTVIPEIDMPGHSHVFDKAMGYGMQTDKGVEALKQILSEAADVFKGVPYLHIGGDEVKITYPRFLETMSAFVREKGMKVVLWNKLVAGPPTAEVCDLTQMWATSGKVVKGLPNIDCRYNYTNHFDVYADLVGIYKSNIYYEQKGTDEVAGTISAAWNDTKTPTETDIIRQNNIYANIIASAERAWMGGGKQYIEKGGTTLPNSGEEFEEFADFERRFLFHKAHSLKDEPIAYVRQSNVRWRITDPFPNGGNKALVLPPEADESEVLPSEFTYQGKQYGTHIATGAGIYLRHIWHPTVPSFYSNPANNQTAYAWTYVYSPVEQDAGAQIEFYTYSRSGNEKAPIAGQWDRRGSKVWVNNREIPAPEWKQPEANIPQDHATAGLTNENLTARPVAKIHLQAGWNKVFLRLPHVNNGGTSRDKWQFTFVVTDTEGRNALPDLVYSPNQCMDEAADAVCTLLDEMTLWMNQNFGSQPGYYPAEMAQKTQEQMDAIRATLSHSMTAEQREEQKTQLQQMWDQLKDDVKDAAVIMPQLSTATHTYWYQFAARRGNRYPTSKGAGRPIIGETTPTDASEWKFVPRKDGGFDIVNRKDGSFVSPESANPQPLLTVATAPQTGWKFLPVGQYRSFALVNGTAQMNMQNRAPYQVLNWGGGTNVTDDGCQYSFTLVDTDGPSTGIAEMENSVSGNAACYDLGGRSVSEPKKGLYIIKGKGKVVLP